MVKEFWVSIKAGCIDKGKSLGLSKNLLTREETDNYIRAMQTNLIEETVGINLGTAIIMLSRLECTDDTESAVIQQIEVPVIIISTDSTCTLAHTGIEFGAAEVAFNVMQISWAINYLGTVHTVNSEINQQINGVSKAETLTINVDTSAVANIYR